MLYYVGCWLLEYTRSMPRAHIWHGPSPWKSELVGISYVLIGTVCFEIIDHKVKRFSFIVILNFKGIQGSSWVKKCFLTYLVHLFFPLPSIFIMFGRIIPHLLVSSKIVTWLTSVAGHNWENWWNLIISVGFKSGRAQAKTKHWVVKI